MIRIWVKVAFFSNLISKKCLEHLGEEVVQMFLGWSFKIYNSRESGVYIGGTAAELAGQNSW